MFQHRHYAAIAKVISTLDVDVPKRDEIAREFAAMFEGDNSRFDHNRFMGAAHNKPLNRKDAR